MWGSLWSKSFWSGLFWPPPDGDAPTPVVWPAICRTSVIGPTEPVHMVSAVEPVHSVTDGSPVHSVILTCE